MMSGDVFWFVAHAGRVDREPAPRLLWFFLLGALLISIAVWSNNIAEPGPVSTGWLTGARGEEGSPYFFAF